MKKALKLAIGICAAVFAAVIFFFAVKSGDLENGNLRNWLSESESRRLAAVRILSASDDNVEIMSVCISRMAALPDSGDVKIKDAASLCAMGIALNSPK